jgi:hypothetical protein
MYHITSEPSDIDYDRLAKFSDVNFLFMAKDGNWLSCSDVAVNVKDLSGEDNHDIGDVLCVDFGTTNTSVGNYKKDGPDNWISDLVTFNTQREKLQLAKLFPTVVLVDSCKDNKINYKFGYEAKKIIEENNYFPQASFFYSLKNWVYHPELEVEINDEDGYKAKVQRKDIIKAYIQHVINFAEHHFKSKFKRIHFSTPVKQKEDFIKFFKELLPEQDIVEVNETIDEGMAIVYSYIHSMIHKADSVDAEIKGVLPKKLLIIDSGGGTTDLSSVDFVVTTTDNDSTYSLEIKSNYEKGASNFGGNNITYRIMKLIKIKLAKHIGFSLEDSFFNSKSDDAIYKEIDETNGVDSIYKDFEVAYDEAERIIPTKFAVDKFKSRKEILAVKQNFYLLWEIADIVKKEFFKQSKVERISFVDENKKEGKIKLPIDIDYNIKKYENSKFERLFSKDDNKKLNLSISLKEIKRIIQPDIYFLIKQLIGSDEVINGNKNGENYKAVVLSGQTTKIDLFAELLKEFIPGRSLREALHTADMDITDDSIDKTQALKLKCVDGSINFFMDKDYDKVNSKIKTDTNKLNYVVRNKNHSISEDKTMEMYKINKKGKVSKLNFQVFDVVGAKQTIFSIDTVDGTNIRNCSYRFSKISSNDIDLKLLVSKITPSKTLGDDLYERLNDIKRESARIIMTIPDVKRHGFKIIEIIKKNQKFKEPLETFEYFEDYVSESNDFFNGKR